MYVQNEPTSVEINDDYSTTIYPSCEKNEMC